jgi:hypothetical protein
VRALLLDAAGARVTVRRRALLGSGPEADLLVAAAGVEPLHAELRPAGGAWVIAAREGAVLHNGEAVEQAVLAAGDRLDIGDARLTVSLGRELPLRPVLWLAVLAAIVTCGVFVASLAEAEPPRTASPIELEAGGPARTWEGASDTLHARLAMPDPRHIHVELHVDLAGHRGPVSVTLNGSPVAKAGEAPIVLRDHLVAGENHLVLWASPATPLRRVGLRVSVLPLPRCDGGGCAAALQSSLARAERLERERRAGPANLFHAWSLLRKARGLAIASGDAPAQVSIEERLSRVDGALERRCAQLRFAAARSLALEDGAAARRTADEMLAAFPSDEHPCRASGEELVRLLDEGGW